MGIRPWPNYTMLILDKIDHRAGPGLPDQVPRRPHHHRILLRIAGKPGEAAAGRECTRRPATPQAPNPQIRLNGPILSLHPTSIQGAPATCQGASVD